VEMRDRIKGFGQLPGVASVGGAQPEGTSGPQSEAFSALVSLGYKPPEIVRLLKTVDASVQTTEEIIRRALQAAAMK
jgi:holliday junction DNA helicase RuvA